MQAGAGDRRKYKLKKNRKVITKTRLSQILCVGIHNAV